MSRRRKTNVDQLKSFLPTEGFKGVNKMKYSIEYMVSIDFLISQTFAPITTKAFFSHFFYCEFNQLVSRIRYRET